MQSFLQYRRFRRNLEEQINRHGLERVVSYQVQPKPVASRPLFHRNEPGSEISTGGLDGERGLDQEEKQLESTISKPDTNTQINNSSGISSSGVEFDRRRQGDALERETNGTGAPNHDLDTRNTRHVASDTLPEVPTSLTASSDSSINDPTENPLTTVSTQQTHRSTGTHLGQAMTGVNIHTPRTNEKGHGSGSHVLVVGYQGPQDLMNPHNWSLTHRICCTLLISQVGFIVGFASSIDSAAAPQAGADLHVGEVASTLPTAMYLLGFGLGAPFAGPLSETFGRNAVYIFTLGMFMIWIMASALAPNIAALAVFRFIAGFFGTTPLTCAGGSISDMWDANERTLMFPLFSMFAFTGPTLGPVIGSFVAQSSALSWRWCDWITLLWSGLILALLIFFLPETYAPILLKWKATHLRTITGDGRYMSEIEVRNTKLLDRIIANMYRPILLFVYEPIAILFTLYLTIVYVVFFTFLTGFKFIFSETYGLSQGLTGLIFISLGIGFFGMSPFVPWIYTSYQRKLKEVQAQGGTRLAPEQRLTFAMLGAPWMPVGLFWMGWTAYRSVSIWVPIIACIPTGFAIMGVFISTYQYLIDAYEAHAASALVGVTFVRYIVSAGMLPASIPFYSNLGVHWTLTILGCISAVMAPVPFIFWKYGAKIRKHSRYATEKL